MGTLMLFYGEIILKINDKKAIAEKAVELLKNTDEKIMNISLECGFTSLTSFNKAFKNSVGITPIELRSIYKK